MGAIKGLYNNARFRKGIGFGKRLLFYPPSQGLPTTPAHGKNDNDGDNPMFDNDDPIE